MPKRELNIKPSCTRQILGFPPAESGALWEKIERLLEDPLPDGHQKKKLKGHSHVYRLRIGSWRLLYTFGDTWIRLLGLRRRKDDTYKRTIPSADAPAHLPPAHEEDIADEPSEPPRPAFEWTPPPVQAAEAPASDAPRPPDNLLPIALTPDWLAQLHVPVGHVPALIACRTEEELLSLDVPDEYLQRVIDNLWARPVEEALEEPDLVVRDTSDLARFKEGSLLNFLLKLDPAQARLTEWALRGPTLVKGGAGTGKSTVALYRVQVILQRAPGARLLFATYTRALKNASEQLLDQLLAPAARARVRVATCDQIAREIVDGAVGRPTIASEHQRRDALRDTRDGFLPAGGSGFDRKLRARALAKLSDDYLLEEFDWILEGRGLDAAADYLAADRAGRGRPFGEKLRQSVWELHRAYLQTLRGRGLQTWGQVRLSALSALRADRWSQRYDGVLVDEAQDLTPAAMSLMAEICAAPEGLFFAADTKQTLYARGGWRAIHPRLRFVGRTAVLKRNYRSTAELDRAAFSVLDPAASPEPSESVRSGEAPVLVTGISREQEATRAGRFVQEATRRLRMKLNTAAILTPSRQIGRHLADHLYRLGLPARFFEGRDLDLSAPVVKVMTLHAAKGLEFPVVALAGFWPGVYPEREHYDTEEAWQEDLSRHRRLIYVGMTRAMRALMVLRADGCADPVLTALDPNHWQIEEA